MATILQSVHVALLISDLDQAQNFYGQLLGLKAAPRALSFPGLWYQVGEFQLHLIYHEGWQAPVPTGKWGRNPHIAFQVDNLEPIRMRLAAHDYPIQMSSSGRIALFTQDDDRNVIELSQA